MAYKFCEDEDFSFIVFTVRQKIRIKGQVTFKRVRSPFFPNDFFVEINVIVKYATKVRNTVAIVCYLYSKAFKYD